MEYPHIKEHHMFFRISNRILDYLVESHFQGAARQ